MNLAVNKLLFTFLYEYDGNELREPGTWRRTATGVVRSAFRVHGMTLENRGICLTKFEQVISNPKASTSASEESSACELRFWA